MNSNNTQKKFQLNKRTYNFKFLTLKLSEIFEIVVHPRNEIVLDHVHQNQAATHENLDEREGIPNQEIRVGITPFIVVHVSRLRSRMCRENYANDANFETLSSCFFRNVIDLFLPVETCTRHANVPRENGLGPK